MVFFARKRRVFLEGIRLDAIERDDEM